jgi:FtsH-binding integral membrane protein
MSEPKVGETVLRHGELPPIPDGCGILPVAENRIAFGPHPQLLDVLPEGYEAGSAAPEGLEPSIEELRTEPVHDRLEPIYRRVLSRAVALAAAALLLEAAVAASLADGSQLRLGILGFGAAARVVFDGIFLAQMLLMSLFNRYVEKLPILPAAVLLFAYAFFCGMEFSILFSPKILAIALLCVALVYGAAAAWGLLRQADLANPLAGVLMICGGGLLLIAVNQALHTSKFVWAVSSVAVVTFSLVEMYCAQKIRDFYQEFDDDNAEGWKASVLGALLLMANAINVYLLASTFLSREVSEEAAEERESNLTTR